jgi:hypothetical protein
MLSLREFGILEFYDMNDLQEKQKRWKFLNELYNRGVISVGSQIERHGDEIMLMNIEIEINRKRISEEREIKINSLLNE